MERFIPTFSPTFGNQSRVPLSPIFFPDLTEQKSTALLVRTLLSATSPVFKPLAIIREVKNITNNPDSDDPIQKLINKIPILKAIEKLAPVFPIYFQKAPTIIEEPDEFMDWIDEQLKIQEENREPASRASPACNGESFLEDPHWMTMATEMEGNAKNINQAEVNYCEQAPRRKEMILKHDMTAPPTETSYQEEMITSDFIGYVDQKLEEQRQEERQEQKQIEESRAKFKARKKQAKSQAQKNRRKFTTQQRTRSHRKRNSSKKIR